MQSKQLRADYRVQLFSALLKLNDKQGPWDQTLQLLNKGQQAARQAQLQDLVDEFEKGQESVLEQLKSIGHFLPWELVLIELGLATGNINESFARLQEHYLVQQQFTRELMHQLKWPLLVVVAVLVAVLVWAFAGQELAVLGVIIHLLISLMVLYVLARGLYGVCQMYRNGKMPYWLLSLVRKMPGTRALILSAQTYHYLKNLQQCTNSGLPLLQSLKLSAKKLPDAFFVQRFMAVHDAVDSGQKLSLALAQCGILEGITVEPIKKSNANVADAQQLLCDSAFQSYVERLSYWARWLPQLLYAFLPLVALVNLLLM